MLGMNRYGGFQLAGRGGERARCVAFFLVVNVIKQDAAKASKAEEPETKYCTNSLCTAIEK